MKFETTYLPDNKSLLRQLGVYEQYHPIVIEASKEYNIDWSVVAGLGSRESHWGLALRPKGPAGRGDFAPRHCVGRAEKFRSNIHPPDGPGFGRGLLQVDFDSHEFARTGNWKDPKENIFYGCKVLANSISIIKRRCATESGAVVVSGYDPERLVRYGLAAYNAGPLAVLTAIRQGVDVDSVTAGENYSADILNLARWFSERLVSLSY